VSLPPTCPKTPTLPTPPHGLPSWWKGQREQALRAVAQWPPKPPYPSVWLDRGRVGLSPLPLINIPLTRRWEGRKKERKNREQKKKNNRKKTRGNRERKKERKGRNIRERRENREKTEKKKEEEPQANEATPLVATTTTPPRATVTISNGND
jgi:hypothetical protein